MEKSELYSAFLKAKIKGKTEEEIEYEALQMGWDKNEIDESFRDISIKPFEMIRIYTVSFLGILFFLFLSVLPLNVIDIINIRLSSSQSIMLLILISTLISNIIYSKINPIIYIKLKVRDALIISCYFLLTIILLFPLISTLTQSGEEESYSIVMWLLGLPFLLIFLSQFAATLFISLILTKIIAKKFVK